MLICSKLLSQGQGLSQSLISRADSVALTWDTRQKSRFDAHTEAGVAIAVFLPRGTTARGGDILVAEDGRLICVQSAPQTVLRIAV